MWATVVGYLEIESLAFMKTYELQQTKIDETESGISTYSRCCGTSASQTCLVAAREFNSIIEWARLDFKIQKKNKKNKKTFSKKLKKMKKTKTPT